MLRIFAKLKTDEKVLIHCHVSETVQILQKLEEEFGGTWSSVDELNSSNEILKFSDGMFYKGFEPGKERYCKAINKINLIRLFNENN